MNNICSFISSYRCMLDSIKWLLLTSFLPFSTAISAQDALEQAASMTPLARYSLLMDIDRVGEHLIAVGERGHILRSSDEGSSWQQVSVPVRVPLTATFFINDQRGWAVGHDGVVLRTDDAGLNWIKLLDGNQANQLMFIQANDALVKVEAQLAKAQSVQDDALIYELSLAQENLMMLVDDAQSFIDEGPTRPFLDVRFKDVNEGFIIGAFGLILHTLDGGDSWQAWSDRIDNPDLFHFNAIKAIGDSLFIAGEAGNLYRSDDDGQQWQLLDSPYEGTFFGLVPVGQAGIITFGLRGNAYFSQDNGDSWDKIATGVDSSFFNGTRVNDNVSVLVGAGGVMLYVDSQGKVLAQQYHPRKLPISGVVTSKHGVILTSGFGGINQAQPLTLLEQDHD